MTIQEARLKELMATPMYKSFIAAGYTKEPRYPEVGRCMLRSTVCEVGEPLSKSFYKVEDGENVLLYIIEIALLDTGIIHNYGKLFSNYIFEAHARLSTDWSVDRCASVDIHFHAESVAAIENRVRLMWESLGSISAH